MRLFLILSFIFCSAIAFAADKTTEIFTLDHQMSEMCKKKITENLRFEKGVSKIDVSLKENTITITFDSKKTNTEKLIEAFKKIGFNACIYNPEQHSDKENGDTQNGQTNSCPGHCCS